jgi:hypothetical protein
MKRLTCAVLGCLAAGSVLACGRAATEPSALAPTSLRISVTTQAYGGGWSFAFVVRVDGGADRPIPENGSLVIDPIAAGVHTVTLVTNYPWIGFAGCRISMSQVSPVTVSVTIPASGMGRVNFGVVCSP